MIMTIMIMTVNFMMTMIKMIEIIMVTTMKALVMIVIMMSKIIKNEGRPLFTGQFMMHITVAISMLHYVHRTNCYIRL